MKPYLGKEQFHRWEGDLNYSFVFPFTDAHLYLDSIEKQPWLDCFTPMSLFLENYLIFQYDFQECWEVMAQTFLRDELYNLPDINSSYWKRLLPQLDQIAIQAEPMLNRIHEAWAAVNDESFEYEIVFLALNKNTAIAKPIIPF